jgi:hypothetical protein
MIATPNTICKKCMDNFTKALESGQVTSGSINIFCEHNWILLASEVHAGLLIDWILLPCSNESQGFAMVEEIRRGLVEIIQQTTEKVLSSGDFKHDPKNTH